MSERRGRSASSDAGPYKITEHVDNNIAEMDSHQPELSHLRTKAESRALSETIQVWTVELPVKTANNVLM